MLDDWLLENVSDREARELLEIIEGRMRTGALLICSQFATVGWHAKLGENKAVADAIVDRITPHSVTIHIGGEKSMRKRIG